MPLRVGDADLGVYSRYKTFGDFQQEAEKNAQAKALQDAQLQHLKRQDEIASQKALIPDVDKLGEVAIYKAAQGIPLSLAEQSAAKFVNAKSGGVQFDPTTGNMLQKPNILSQMGINLGDEAPQLPNAAPPDFPLDPKNSYDKQFKQVLDASKGNPKLQQQLLADYSKDKFNMNESQSRNAGFADRMAANEPVLEDPKVVDALANPFQKFLGAVPMVGNYLTSDEFQSGDQAQRDFINSVLRRESGAVISPSEFVNARKQYFPQPGDSDATLAQKAVNRQNALAGIQRSAGPAYRPIDGPIPAIDIDPAKAAAVGMADPNETIQLPQKALQSKQKYNSSKSPKVKFLGYE